MKNSTLNSYNWNDFTKLNYWSNNKQFSHKNIFIFFLISCQKQWSKLTNIYKMYRDKRKYVEKLICLSKRSFIRVFKCTQKQKLKMYPLFNWWNNNITVLNFHGMYCTYVCLCNHMKPSELAVTLCSGYACTHNFTTAYRRRKFRWPKNII